LAESSLSVAYTELRQEVGFFLGYGRTIGNWNVAQAAEVEAAVQAGVRRVYFPAGIQGAEGHNWTWLHPSKTLSTAVGDYDYNLPDDFGRLVGDIHFPAETAYPAIVQVSTGDILEMKSLNDDTGIPKFCAVRPRASDGTSGQRWELILWPKPQAIWALLYKYEAYTGKLTDAAPYPLGGMELAEVYIESCLAVAEQRVNDGADIHTQAFQVLLTDAVARDRRKGTSYYGYMGHREGVVERRKHGDTGETYPITYKGSPV